MRNKYYFISDIHLGLQNKVTEENKEKSLVKLLEQVSEDAKELFILGDLFDYWFEYRYVAQKGYYRTFTALKKCADAGVKIHYIIGNHDFMHRDFFANEFDAKLYDDPVELVLDGYKFYLGHGDGLLKNDTGYNIIKKILRNKFLQGFYSLIHPDIGISLASNTSKKSRDYTSKKDLDRLDGLFEVAKKRIDLGDNFVIFGHLHRRRFEQYKTGYYINLGTWLKEPCYGLFNNGKFEIIDWKN